jgi:hypothetical protein
VVEAAMPERRERRERRAREERIAIVFFFLVVGPAKNAERCVYPAEVAMCVGPEEMRGG